jgi:D-alanyl-D-alanine carboxypeptidase
MNDHLFRRSRRVTTLVALSGLALIGGLAVPAGAGALTAGHRADDAVRQRVDALVQDGFPAALASVRDRGGRVRDYTAGVGDLKTRSKVPVDGQVRLGSNTKTFTAVAVLQLVGEGKVDLDQPIEKYLPNLIRGDGIDGRHITVRQLLQHTSGLPNYTSFLANGFLPYQHTY